MKEYFILQLLHKQFTGQLEEVDKSLLSDWVSQSPENKAFSDSILKIWQASANFAPPVSFENRTESALDRFRSAIRQEAITPATQESTILEQPTAKIRTLTPLKWISGIAASAIILLSAVFLLDKNSGDNSYASLATLSEQKQEIQLIDRSTVWVNEKSTVKYFDEVPSKERKVFLDGVAFFDVEKSDKPFVIETDNAVITVLGTKFNVNADKDGTTVMVKEGKVQLQPKLSNKHIILMENMTGIYEVDTKKLYRKQASSYKGDSWIRGGYSFEDDSLEDVFSVLENHYNVDIIIQNDDLKKCVFTSPVYQDSTLESVLDVMQLIYGFNYALKDGIYHIEGGSCS